MNSKPILQWLRKHIVSVSLTVLFLTAITVWQLELLLSYETRFLNALHRSNLSPADIQLVEIIAHSPNQLEKTNLLKWMFRTHSTSVIVWRQTVVVRGVNYECFLLDRFIHKAAPLNWPMALVVINTDRNLMATWDEVALWSQGYHSSNLTNGILTIISFSNFSNTFSVSVYDLSNLPLIKEVGLTFEEFNEQDLLMRPDQLAPENGELRNLIKLL